jgi:hypothetical protein
MYGGPTAAEALPWDWVDDRLRSAGTLWVVAAGAGPPHPRPVWGVWDGAATHLSLGSPVLRRELRPGTPAAVHLDSGTDVVVVEGTAAGTTSDAALIASYDAKYDWHYDLDRYGPFTTIVAAKVLAWRAAGPAGRDGFVGVGCWTFDR